MSEIQEKADQSNAQSNETSHIAVVVGQGLQFTINDMISDYQRKINYINEEQITTGAGTIESIRLGAKRMCYNQIIKDIQDRLLNCDPVFEPTDEQIEKSVEWYVKVHHPKVKDVLEVQALENHYIDVYFKIYNYAQETS